MSKLGIFMAMPYLILIASGLVGAVVGLVKYVMSHIDSPLEIAWFIWVVWASIAFVYFIVVHVLGSGNN